jgi:hypothetical protein
MSRALLLRSGCCALVTALAAAVLLTGTASGASGPAWTVSSYSTPTRVDPSAHGVDDVQEIIARATEGVFLLEVESEQTAIIPYNATAAEVQAALEAISTVGPGNVAVMGGPGDETGSKPYRVTFTGVLGSQQIVPISPFSAFGLPGGQEGSLVVREVNVGASAANYVVTATNTGSAPTTPGSPVVLEDTLPTGAQAGGVSGQELFSQGHLRPGSCSLGPPVRCEYSGSTPVGVGDSVRMNVHLAGFAGSGISSPGSASVSGGGASEGAGVQYTTPLGIEPAPFGLSNVYTALSDVQAGAHPNITTGIVFNSSALLRPSGDPQEVRAQLPPGFVGNPNPANTPRCTMSEVIRNVCPASAAVGVASTGFTSGSSTKEAVFNSLIYNIVPSAGEPAAFAFFPVLLPVRLDTRLRSNGDYGIEVLVKGISQAVQIDGTSLTFWGNPSQFNGPGPYRPTNLENTFGGPGGGVASPFTTNPTSCAPVGSGVQVSTRSWQEPGVLAGPLSAPFPTMQGCEKLRFEPALRVSPDSFEPGVPAGYGTELEIPQSSSPSVPATPALRYATVTLPAGTVISPSAATGLQACSEAQVELHSSQPLKAAQCPPASKLGEVEVQTPLLAAPLKGALYLAEQNNNPFRSLLALYLVAEGNGVIVKLAGEGQLDPATGQVTVAFKGNPEGDPPTANGNPPLPFSLLKVQLTGGPHAALANSRACGQAVTTSSLASYASTIPATPLSEFTLTPCLRYGFSPAFSAGMTGSPQAGAYSPFSVTFARADGDQELGAITVSTPPGLLGAVSHVAQCPSAQADAGTCSQASEIGTVTASVGPGAEPFHVTGGRAYLTGPYRGAPFGLSIVVPAVAGPFNLGEEVVRAAISVDAHTAALTIVSDPLPTKKDGIPFQVKTVNVNVSRPQFMFNATNCDSQAIGAAISSTQGARAAVSSPYQPVNCATLPFKPSFKASTQARTSKLNGAALDVQVAQRPGEAGIHKVDVQLPLALPSRLTTLQKACTEAQFNANPAGCPPASVVGTATAHTPILNAPLTGPAYLVSHGGAAFPDLVIVLQGEGVKIELVGNTDIKKGITFSRFHTVPDAPITTFELNLPQGPHSALAANGNLCGQSLVMPTTMVGQNGAQATQNTKVAVMGCPRPTVKVKNARVKASAVLITLTTTQSATVTVTGHGLRTTRKALGAGTHQIKVPLTSGGKTARNRHKRTKIKVLARNAQGSTTKTLSVKL